MNIAYLNIMHLMRFGKIPAYAILRICSLLSCSLAIEINCPPPQAPAG